MIALVIRSIIFNVVFFSTITLLLILFSPVVFFDKKYTFIFWNYLSRILNFITIKVGGIDCVVENSKNLLKEPAIYAVRHESAWETLMLIHKFNDPVILVKEELIKIPFFGILSKKVGAISINRKGGAKSLISAIDKVKRSIKEGHPVIIFPEGTRLSFKQYAPLKRGISLFYVKTNCPVVPVIHNSGYFWPRHGFIKKPGSITLKFADPIAPGLSQDEFMRKLDEVFRAEVEKLEIIKAR